MLPPLLKVVPATLVLFPIGRAVPFAPGVTASAPYFTFFSGPLVSGLNVFMIVYVILGKEK